MKFGGTSVADQPAIMRLVAIVRAARQASVAEETPDWRGPVVVVSALGGATDQFLKAAAEAKKPFFLNANITDPHRPFPGGDPGKKKKRPPAAPVKAFDPADVTVPSFLEDISDVRKEVAEYYAGVRRFDQAFGEAMAALKSAGHADDTLIVFLSDHGMSFPFSKATVYRNGTWSPVLLRWPGMPAAAEHAEFISSVDLMPTILDLLGYPAAPLHQGRSLLGDETGPAFFYTDYSLGWLGLRDGCWKYLFEIDSGRSKLFDVCGDPGELRDRAGEFEPRVDDYRVRVRHWASVQQDAVRSGR